MLVSKAIAISLILFAFILVARMHTIDGNPLHQISLPTEKVHSAERMLQAVPVSNPQVNAAITKIINNANSARKGKGLSALTVNSGLQQIVRQWAQSIRGRMSLSQYLQLFAFHSTQAYSFASIPLDYLVDVVERASPALTSRDYNTIGTFSRPADGQNFELIVVLQGGDDSYIKDFNKQAILGMIKAIDSERAAKAAAEKKDVPVQTPSAVNSAKNEPVVVNENKEKVNLNISSSNENAITNNNLNTSKQNDVKHINPGTNLEQPNVVKQAKPENPIPSSNASPVQNKTKNLQITQEKEQIKVSQKPKQTIGQPQKQTQIPKKQQQTKPIQIKPSQPIKKEEPIVKEQQLKESQPQIPPKVQQTQAKPISSIPHNPVPSNNVSIPEQPKPQKIQQKASSPIMPNPSEPARQVANNQSRQRSSSQPSQVNNTSFRNIVLTHNVPSTFVRNQIFPFRGFITVPNPSGVKVNVIFTRVNDQRRLSFSSTLPPNVTNFQILANLALSGNYYLSVFIGLQGQTTLTQYTVIPNFFGRINSKAPAPLIDASLNLIQNDLWLNWSSSEQLAPTLTQIIFSQQSGASIAFLLSNSKASFQVPYAQFASFSPGLTTISIAQAFSSTESAASRTSDFSAPYSIIFNATTHHFAKYSGPKIFQPIPYKIQANGSVVLKGTVPAGGINNEVLLVSPSKNFISHFITGNNGTRIVDSGVAVDFSIPLRQTGVYILQVNNAAGEALINVPLYVGDIYPLLPDFMDLAPTSPDVVALNQPSNIDSRRSIISALINSVRSQYGVPNLYIDNNLNNLAQNYSSTMIQQQIVSHIDRDGSTPSMRAKSAGIQEQIGENLAVNSNLTQAQLMLQRSPVHLRNMVNPLWTRVGIGIAQDSNQVYYLTQQFSSRDMRLFPLTNSELAALQKSIVNYLLSQFPTLREDRQLSSDLANFQQSASNDDAVAYLSGLGYRRFVVDQVDVPYNGGNVIAGIVGNNFFAPEKQHTKLGVSVVYKGGNALIVAAYN